METIKEKEEELINTIIQVTQSTGGLAEINLLNEYIETGAEAFKQNIIKKLKTQRQVRMQGLQNQFNSDKTQINQLLEKNKNYEEEIQEIENLKKFKRKFTN